MSEHIQYRDINGNPINEGDKCKLSIIGIGEGIVNIIKDEKGVLSIHDPKQGYYSLFDYDNNKDMELEIIEE